MAGSTHPRPHIRAILIDLSGNLHVGSTPTPNAVEALHHLRSSCIPFRLCSNTSKESTASLINRLNKMGFGIPPQSNNINPAGAGGLNTRSPREVWTSIGAVSQVLSNLGLKRPFTILSKSAWEEVASAIQVPEDNHPNQSSYSDSFSASQPSASRCSHNNLVNVATTNDNQREFDSVIVGLAPSALNYDNLNTAFRILIGEHPLKDHRCPDSSAFSYPMSVSASGDPNLTTSITAPAATASPDTGAAEPTRGGPELDYPQQGRTLAISIAPWPRLIATHKAKYLESDSPPGLSLGPGPFVSALEIATGVEAHVVGKPTRAFFEAILGDFTVDELHGEDIYGGLINDRRSRTTPATVASRTVHEETEDSMGEAQGDDDYPKPSASRSTAATIVLTTNAGAVRSNNAGKETWGDRGRIAVIGDDVEADLGEGAIELGLWRVLVRTGKYRPGDESRQGIIPPDEVVDTFAEFVDSLLESNHDHESSKGGVPSSGEGNGK